MNRIWQAYFGTGLVETPEDFGTQGAKPSHPELLDWLACEFMDHGWSLKHLHRLIVTSETYQQSSKVTPELLERQPVQPIARTRAAFPCRRRDRARHPARRQRPAQSNRWWSWCDAACTAALVRSQPATPPSLGRSKPTRGTPAASMSSADAARRIHSSAPLTRRMARPHASAGPGATHLFKR